MTLFLHLPPGRFFHHIINISTSMSTFPAVPAVQGDCPRITELAKGQFVDSGLYPPDPKPFSQPRGARGQQQEKAQSANYSDEHRFLRRGTARRAGQKIVTHVTHSARFSCFLQNLVLSTSPIPSSVIPAKAGITLPGKRQRV